MPGLIVNTKHRTDVSNDPSACQISLRSNYVNRYYLEKLILPVSWYTIDSNNTYFYILVGSTTYSATIPVGNYTIDSFVDALETALNTATSTAHYSAAYSTLTNKITITNTNNDTFRVMNTTNSTRNCARQSGFVADSSSAATSQVADAVFDMNRTNYAHLTIGSSTLYTDDRLSSSTVVIPVNASSGDKIVYEPSSNISVTIGSGNYLSLLLYSEDQTILSLNGCNMILVLRTDPVN